MPSREALARSDVRWKGVSMVALALRRVELLIARAATYEEVMAALDDCALQPDADDADVAIESYRVMAAMTYDRSAHECEAFLLRFLAKNPTFISRAEKL